MDLMTLAMAKQYTNSQQLGYTKELTWNGNIEGKQYFEELGAVKVSETAYDLSDVVSITGCDNGEMMKWTLPNPDIVLNTEGGAQFLETDDGSGPLVISVPKDSGIALVLGISGTWLRYISEDAYIAGIELIHPIDPKYLPGVCLPVVELRTAILSANTIEPLFADDSAALDAVYANKQPIVCNVNCLGYEVSVPLMWVGNNSYASLTPIGEFSLARQDDAGWIATLAVG